MDMIEWFQGLTETDDKYLVALLSAIMISSVTDWAFGWINARFNKNVKFESGVALYGIIKKMMYFVSLVLFMFVAFLIVPETVAVPSTYTLFIGYLLSEINSILAHLELTNDGKKGELLKSFLKRLVRKGEK